MASARAQTIGDLNRRLGILLAETKSALHGEREFGVKQIRALAEPIQAMAPIVSRAAGLADEERELTAELDAYKTCLRELQAVLEQVRMMLLVKRSQMTTSHAQLQAVAHWANRLQQTR